MSENKINLNTDQEKVFKYSFSDNKKNLLVSAAAGSGKTRVLVEKIIDMISTTKNEYGSNDSTNLSKMLIMTFTKKATNEMKVRIKSALENKLKSDQSNDSLVKEIATIQNANITTIDSFCKKILEENYAELNKKEWSLYKNFDPSYRIANGSELTILYDNVLDNFLENEVYGVKKYDHFIQSYFKKNSDEAIKTMLRNGLKFLSSLAWPLSELEKWEKKGFEYDNSKLDEEEIEFYDKYKDNVNEKLYIELLKNFYKEVVKEKNKKNLYDVSDYANFALDILYDEVDDNGIKTYKVSKFAEDNIKNKYDYIFVDEYQDTNNIQEKLIDAISKTGNVFMVGDAKQSIYAFRNAEPKIFTEKFKSYKDEKNKLGKLMTMDINYRSDFTIIDFVNDLFSRCMTEDFGKINYKEDGMMEQPSDENNSGLPKEIIEKKKNGKPVEVYIIYDEDNNSSNKKTADTDNRESSDNDDKKSTETDNKESYDSDNKKSANNENKSTTSYTKSEDNKVDGGTKTKENKTLRLEAKFIAEKIQYLHDIEHIAYKDIVILMRSIQSKADIYMDALAKRNIPCYSDMKKGFFNRSEIKLMVDILNIIDNPLQDIPLANVLTSEIIGLNNNELAFIKYIHLKITNYKNRNLSDDILFSHNYLKYLNDDKYAETIKNENIEKINSINKEFEDRQENNKNNPDFDCEKEKLIYEGRINNIKNKEDDIIKQAKDFRDNCLKEYNINFEKLKSKLDKYIKKFDDLRLKSRYLGIGELINEIYSKTDIKSIMASKNDGIMRNANLDVLYDTARSYEESSFVGLFNFMRYLEKIKSLNDDQGLAVISDENDDVVRLMTIHTSKGLEFKCVIIASSGHNYYEKDTNRDKPVQFDKEFGIALDYYDLEKGYNIETLKKRQIIEKKIWSSREEEMRMLYVAMTRAKERLIIVGGVLNRGNGYTSYKHAINERYNYIVGKNLEIENEENKSEGKKVKKSEGKKEKTVKEFKKPTKDCKSYLELILNHYNNESSNCKLEKVGISLDEDEAKLEDKLTIETIINEEKNDIEKEKEILSSGNESEIEIFNNLDEEKIKTNFGFEYQYSYWHEIKKAKMSVSDIKKEHHDEEQMAMKIGKSNTISNAFYDGIAKVESKDVKNDKNESTEIGNAYHRYMQFFDYNKKDFVGNMGNDGSWRKLVDEDKISKFLNTKLGIEMAEAFPKKLFREQKFMKLFSQNDINAYKNKYNKEELSLNDKRFDENNIVIQGIIDAFYIKEDKDGKYIVLVDYKTDGIKSNISDAKLEAKLKDDYTIQLDIYAKALENITGLKVKQIYIYSFALNKEIELNIEV